MEWREDDLGDYGSTEEIADLSDGDNGNDFGYPCEETVNKDGDHETTEKEYTVLKESDIRKRQESDIIHVSTVLSISRVESSLLLRHYQWNVSRLHDEWFADEGKVRTTVGLLNFGPTEEIVALSRKKNTRVCGICFDLNTLSSMLSAGCDHQFCVDCWRGYVTTAICDGPGCLMLRCPEPSCNSAIGEDIINRVTSDEDKEKYYRFLVRSYIEDKKNIKWCPAAGCEFAVEFDDLWTSVKEVTCLCSNTFCWNCLEEVHRPVDCTTVAEWALKNCAESGNVTWIIAYTKPCPKCKRPIQKNNGCNHMTCGAPCKFEFCWLCLGPWKKHVSVSCNAYGGKKQDQDEGERKKARLYLERYTHYFERWNGNQKSRLKALEDLKQMQDVNLEKLGHMYDQSLAQLGFIVDAWKQIVECRRVLKWTYAYGYYLPQEENAKRDLFEYLQGQAELGLERLHSCAEKDLKAFLSDRDDGDGNFLSFRCKLVGLTVTTRNYFENLVSALENGLSDVESKAGCSSSIEKES